MKRAALLLVLMGLAMAGCQGQISMLVPAVVGDGGGLVNVTMGLSPGDGTVYSTIEPRLGLMTQDSIDQAIEIARMKSGLGQDCDVDVRFSPLSSAGYIDGPSAGSALTVMSYALLMNESIRGDAIITGGIGPHGEVVPVGGLYEKAKGSLADGSIRYFITPTESFYELLLLDTLEEEGGLEVLEAEDVDEIIGFMIDDEPIEEKPLEVRLRSAPEIAPYSGQSVPAFAAVASGMISLERAEIAKLAKDGEPYDGIKEFFESEFTRQEAIIGKGYYFTAANEAFLDYIEIATINGVAGGRVDLPRTKGEVGICLSSTDIPQMGDGNYEWVIGARQRIGWASDKVERSMAEEDTLSDEEYTEYNDLMYGKAWCMVARALSDATPEMGAPIDESVWAATAKDWLGRASDMGASGDETATRMRIAEKAYREGSYGAAIYDAAYVIAMEGSVEGTLAPEEELRDSVAMIASEERDSLWGKVYRSQGVFLLEQNQSASALKVLMLAYELDQADAQMKSDILEARGQAEKQESMEETMLGYVMLLLTLVSMFLLGALVTVLFKGMKDGSFGKGPRKAPGAAQEKGRDGIQGRRARPGSKRAAKGPRA